MDRKQLATIAVTALITFTVTEAAKWLMVFSKKTAASDTTKQNVRKIFNKTNRTITGDVLALLFFSLLLWHEMHLASPVTRQDVLYIVCFVIFIGFWVVHLMWVIASIPLKRALKSLESKIESMKSTIEPKQKD